MVARTFKYLCAHRRQFFAQLFYRYLFYRKPRLGSSFAAPVSHCKNTALLLFYAARGIFDTRDFFFYILLIVAAQGFSVFLLYVQEESR